MPKKAEYAKVLNELFGTHIKWEKLSREELAELATILNNPSIILEKLGVKQEYKRKLIRERIIEAGAELFEEWEGPLVSLARRVLMGEGKGKEKPKEA